MITNSSHVQLACWLIFATLSCNHDRMQLLDKSEVINIGINDSALQVFDSPNNLITYTVLTTGQQPSRDSVSIKGLIAYYYANKVEYFDADVRSNGKLNSGDSSYYFVDCKLPWQSNILKSIQHEPRNSLNCKLLIWLVKFNGDDITPIYVSTSSSTKVEIQTAPGKWEDVREQK